MKRLRGKSERGNAILEFALGWSILWIMFSGVYQIGYAYFVYNRLMLAAANAAELGSRMNYDTGAPSTFSDALKNMVVYGDETHVTGVQPIVPNLQTSNVNVSVTLDAAGTPRDVTVNITGYTISALFTSFNLNSKPRATVMYLGRVVCASC